VVEPTEVERKKENIKAQEVQKKNGKLTNIRLLLPTLYYVVISPYYK